MLDLLVGLICLLLIFISRAGLIFEYFFKFFAKP
jgi:hypothetical protein